MWPERWWTMPDQVEVRGNPDGRPKQFWRANRLSELGIGAKDQSNHLVAGSLRSFPQDSWCIYRFIKLNKSYLVKRMIRVIRFETFLTYSQTINGYDIRVSWLNSYFTLRRTISNIYYMFVIWFRFIVPSGPSFGKQNWCCGMNQSWW